MKLKVKPASTNSFPLRAVLIRGSEPTGWAREIGLLEYDLSEIDTYPLPNTSANSIWGCLVVPRSKSAMPKPDRHEACQLLSDLLFIPEHAAVFPKLRDSELKELLLQKAHLFHPEIGLTELPEALNWTSLIEAVEPKPITVTKPEPSVFVPHAILSMRVWSPPVEEVIQSILKDAVPSKEEFNDKPLNLLEKAKLATYRKLLKSGGSGAGGGGGLGTGLLRGLSKLMGSGSMMNNMIQDLEDLERRNKKAADKLMDMLRDNPALALRYAIPLDNAGTGRSTGEGLFNLSPIWSSFSLFGGGGGGRSGYGPSVSLGQDKHNELDRQYRLAANRLEQEGDYKKAAFIFLKLLKEPTSAVEVLIRGKLFAEAAVLSLKELKNKRKAAECYEQGKMYKEAAELFRDLEENERAGDLFAKINNMPAANDCYEKVVQNHLHLHRYIKAALLSRDKMRDKERSQEITLSGWHKNVDAANCLDFYLSGIPDYEDRRKRLQQIYDREVAAENNRPFLEVLKRQFGHRQPEHQPEVRKMAIAIIAEEVKGERSIIYELNHFKPTDSQLKKDVFRFRSRKNR